MNATQWMLLIGGAIFLAGCAGAGKILGPSGVKPLGMPVGLVVHAMTAADAVAIAALGVRQVRLSYYGPDTLATIREQLHDAHAAGLNALVVCYANPSAIPATDVLAGDRFQWENEPADVPAYAMEYAAMRAMVPLANLVPAGLGNGVQASEVQDALPYGLGQSGVLCLHAYGHPLENAVTDRVAMARRAGWTGGIWLTELGVQEGPEQATELQAALETAAGLGVARAYVYAYRSPDDGFTLTPDTQATIRGLLA